MFSIKKDIRNKQICCHEQSLSWDATQHLELLNFFLEWKHYLNYWCAFSGNIFRQFISDRVTPICDHSCWSPGITPIPLNGNLVTTLSPAWHQGSCLCCSCSQDPWRTPLDIVAIPEPFLRLSPSKSNECVGCGWAFSPLLSLECVLHHLPWSTKTLWSPSACEWKVHLESCAWGTDSLRSPCHN